MTQQQRAAWFTVTSVILVGFGIFYVFFGLHVLPVSHAVVVPWESALYGAIMTGWGVTLLLIGRVAFRREDAELKRALLIGLAIWLTLEAAASVWFGVWFNAGVDIAVLALFALPLRSRGGPTSSISTEVQHDANGR
jgi:hypothetical protein